MKDIYFNIALHLLLPDIFNLGQAVNQNYNEYFWEQKLIKDFNYKKIAATFKQTYINHYKQLSIIKCKMGLELNQGNILSVLKRQGELSFFKDLTNYPYKFDGIVGLVPELFIGDLGLWGNLDELYPNSKYVMLENFDKHLDINELVKTGKAKGLSKNEVIKMLHETKHYKYVDTGLYQIPSRKDITLWEELGMIYLI